MNPLEITLLILLVTIIAFVSGKVPFSVISTGIILALILTGIKTPAEAFGGFINTNVVMFVAMFVIGAGLTKTPLIDKAQSLVIRYKDNMRMLTFRQAQSSIDPSLTCCPTKRILVLWRPGPGNARPGLESESVLLLVRCKSNE